MDQSIGIFSGRIHSFFLEFINDEQDHVFHLRIPYHQLHHKLRLLRVNLVSIFSSFLTAVLLWNLLLLLLFACLLVFRMKDSSKAFLAFLLSQICKVESVLTSEKLITSVKSSFGERFGFLKFVFDLMDFKNQSESFLRWHYSLAFWVQY